MRLINTTTMKLEDFSTSSTTPPYAILSHTWGDGEVTFQDILSQPKPSKKGYDKIRGTCRKAQRHGYKYAWVDTCCIDKSSSAELTESINSMFQWYKNAAICYVFVEDIEGNDDLWSMLPNCKWFTRGWTLQELLAPSDLRFYDTSWKYIGSKLELIDIISSSTKIPGQLLRAEKDLSWYSVAERMSWAASRQTTRTEDVAYCLLGIFDVNMPLIYGEGIKAFRRLQEEIIKRNNDLSIFAWEGCQKPGPVSLFAPSPTGFSWVSQIVRDVSTAANFSVTNEGLLMSNNQPLEVITVTLENGIESSWYVLTLVHDTEDSEKDQIIYLKKIGPGFFFRDRSLSLTGFHHIPVRNINRTWPLYITNFIILIDPPSTGKAPISSFRENAIHIPYHDVFTLERMVPETPWDVSDRVFLKTLNRKGYPMIVGMTFRGTIAATVVNLIVICDYTMSIVDYPIAKVFEEGTYQSQERMLFHGRNQADGTLWPDSPDFWEIWQHIHESVDVRVGESVSSIKVSFDKKIVESVSTEVELYCLNLTVIEKS